MSEVWHLYLFYGILVGIGRSPMNVTLKRFAEEHA
jgi:hypothetical protein